MIKNVIYQHNNKLGLYIISKQSAKKKDINKSVNDIETCSNTCVNYNINTNTFNKIEFYNEDYISETNLNKHIVNALLKSYLEKKNGCVLSFINLSEQLKKQSNNIQHDINSNKKNYNNKFYNNLNDTNTNIILNNFFTKVNETTVKQKQNYSLQYVLLGNFYYYDLLENYHELTENYQKIKSCALKGDEKTNNIKNNRTYDCRTDNYKKTNVPVYNELNIFKRKNKKIDFINAKKLKDIFCYVEKQENVLKGKSNNMNSDSSSNSDPFYLTLIHLNISNNIEEGNTCIFETNMSYNTNKQIKINNNSINTSVTNSFYFINVYYINNNENAVENGKNKRQQQQTVVTDYELKKDKSETNKLKQLLSMFSNIINNYDKEGSTNIDSTDFKIISHIFSEIYKDVTTNIFLKIVLDNSIKDSTNKTNEELMLNFVYSINLNMKNILNNDNNKNINNSENVHTNLKENENKDFLILKDEKYYKICNMLFNNIDLDENAKCKIIKKIITYPEQYFDKLSHLKNKFEHNFNIYKDKEKDIYNEISYLIKKQNLIIKKYKEEEEKTKNDILNILEQITHINEQNIEINNEIKKNQNLNVSFIKEQKNWDEQNLKKIQTADMTLNKEYETFISFRNESFMYDKKKKEKDSQKSEDKKKTYIPKESQSYSINEKSINETNINEEQKKECLYNLNEAMKYAEQIFQETYDLKKQYDEIINEKFKMFNVLKNTALQLNEKTTSLTNDFKSTKGLKLICPLNDNSRINLKTNYEQTILNLNNDIKAYKNLLKQLDTEGFNDKQLDWIHKMNSISKKF
ncbi:conserved protein, unknown function [Hepatocystis sp. ex Piliocolobus tephrosceles]|nr:conserved protein, unknown function [Hepatocystis sp. ex Piliocolobus tephrosceles]